MSADYFLPPEPNTSDPDPLAKSKVSLRVLQAAGVDTGEIIIRGGTHYDFDWIPNPGFTATLRGADEIAWYTTAWFDKYVKGGDASADSRLLTSRWRNDEPEAAVDPTATATCSPSTTGRGSTSGWRRRALPERGHARRQAGLRADCEPAAYAYIDIVNSPDSSAPRSRGCPVAVAGSGPRCIARRLAVSAGGSVPRAWGAAQGLLLALSRRAPRTRRHPLLRQRRRPVPGRRAEGKDRLRRDYRSRSPHAPHRPRQERQASAHQRHAASRPRVAGGPPRRRRPGCLRRPPHRVRFLAAVSLRQVRTGGRWSSGYGRSPER